MRKTIAAKIIEDMINQNYILAGVTKGYFSFRKGSNLYKKIIELGLSEDCIKVKKGARAGRSYCEGWQLLIFKKEV
jgi:hypothetical protein